MPNQQDTVTLTVTDLIEIKVALGQILERQRSDREAADHRHANTRMILETFVPRREIESDNKGRDDRIEKLEAAQSRAIWAIVGTALSGLTFAGAVGRKVGFLP